MLHSCVQKAPRAQPKDLSPKGKAPVQPSVRARGPGPPLAPGCDVQAPPPLGPARPGCSWLDPVFWHSYPGASVAVLGLWRVRAACGQPGAQWACAQACRAGLGAEEHLAAVNWGEGQREGGRTPTQNGGDPGDRHRSPHATLQPRQSHGWPH